MRFAKDVLCNAVESLRDAASAGIGRARRFFSALHRGDLTLRQRRAAVVASCALLACLAFCAFMAWLIASIARCTLRRRFLLSFIIFAPIMVTAAAAAIPMPMPLTRPIVSRYICQNLHAL